VGGVKGGTGGEPSNSWKVNEGRLRNNRADHVSPFGKRGDQQMHLPGGTWKRSAAGSFRTGSGKGGFPQSHTSWTEARDRPKRADRPV